MRLCRGRGAFLGAIAAFAMLPGREAGKLDQVEGKAAVELV